MKKLRVKADSEEWIENKQLSEFQRQYEEYLEPTKLLTEEQFIKQLRLGNVIKAEIVGQMSKLSALPKRERNDHPIR